MRAVRLHDAGGGKTELRLDNDVPVPTPKAGEVLLAVRACGLNQVDLLTRDGQTPQTPPMPHISGTEVAGDVVAVGPGVTQWSVGDRVVLDPILSCGECASCLRGATNMCVRGRVFGVQTPGGYAERVVAPAKQLLRLPDSLSYAQAAAAAVTGPTAWHMLRRRADIRIGEDVLIIAAGSGIGVIGMQIAALAGARVIATAGSEDKVRQALDMGAHFAVNHRDPSWADQVRKWTGGRGVDVVFEHVGKATWEGSPPRTRARRAARHLWRTFRFPGGHQSVAPVCQGTDADRFLRGHPAGLPGRDAAGRAGKDPARGPANIRAGRRGACPGHAGRPAGLRQAAAGSDARGFGLIGPVPPSLEKESIDAA